MSAPTAMVTAPTMMELGTMALQAGHSNPAGTSGSPPSFEAPSARAAYV